MSVIADYNPNIAWGKQHVEVTLKAWSYSAVHVVKVGGNCLGLEVMESAFSQIMDHALDGVPEGHPPRIVLTDPDGRNLICEDDDDRGEDWLKNMAVSVRIVGYDPPTVNEVRAINGAEPLPDGDRPSIPL